MLHHHTLSTRERFAILASLYTIDPRADTPQIRQCLCGATVYQYPDGSKVNFGNGHGPHKCPSRLDKSLRPKPNPAPVAPTPAPATNGTRLDKSLRRTNAATIE